MGLLVSSSHCSCVRFPLTHCLTRALRALLLINQKRGPGAFNVVRLEKLELQFFCIEAPLSPAALKVDMFA